jgi:multicomponent Na+:H+ antiporter subunit D
MRITGICFLTGGLALAALPPFGTWLGKTLAEDGLSHTGYGWAGVLFVAVSAITGGAVLRAGTHIFLGVGTPPDTEGDTRGRDEHPEIDHDISRAPMIMLAPIVVLLAGGLILGLLPGLATHARDAARQLLDPASYAAAALDGIRATSPPGAPMESWSASSILLGLLSAALAMLVAAVGLYTDRLPQSLRGGFRVLSAPLRVLRAAHSGLLGDYVVWLLLGVAVLAVSLGVQ